MMEIKKEEKATMEYSEEQIQVLEGLEAVRRGLYVHRKHIKQRPASPGLRNSCKQHR